jgi:hypothetical protein
VCFDSQAFKETNSRTQAPKKNQQAMQRWNGFWVHCFWTRHKSDLLSDELDGLVESSLFDKNDVLGGYRQARSLIAGMPQPGAEQ